MKLIVCISNLFLISNLLIQFQIAYIVVSTLKVQKRIQSLLSQSFKNYIYMYHDLLSNIEEDG